jgi:acylglycerol lipase
MRVSNVITQTLSTEDGLKLVCRSYKTDNPVANIFLVHGYAEHSERYNWLSQQLNTSGFNFFTFDLRGHGKSEGERAYIYSFDQYTEDLDIFLKHFMQEDLPTFLMGHSMGSLISVKYLIQNKNSKIKGFISSAGALKIDDNISPFIRKISGLLSTFAPKLKTVKLDPTFMSRIPEIKNAYINDPLIYHEGTKARLGSELLKNMQYVQSHFGQFNLTVLILHGTGDKLTDPLGSQWMYDNISSKDKTIQLFEGLYHEILHEPEKEEIVQIIVEWIKKRCF